MDLMRKLKDWDVAAMVTMLLALSLELATWLATDESLLAMVPEPLAAVVFGAAAYARWRASKGIDTEGDEGVLR